MTIPRPGANISLHVGFVNTVNTKSWLEKKTPDIKIEIYLFNRKIQIQYIFSTKIQENISCFSEVTTLLNFCLLFWSFDFSLLKLNTFISVPKV